MAKRSAWRKLFFRPELIAFGRDVSLGFRSFGESCTMSCTVASILIDRHYRCHDEAGITFYAFAHLGAQAVGRRFSVPDEVIE